jgi:MFS family permease
VLALTSLVAFEAFAVVTAMPTVATALDGLALYGLAFGAAFAAGVVGMVISGIWCDLRGPVAVMWNGVVIFAVGSAVVGTAPVMELVVLGRVVQGLGGGMVSVALYVVIGKAYPPQLHPRVLGALAAAWVVPSMVGPALSGLLVETVGWRWVFGCIPVLALWAAFLLRPGLRAIEGAGTGTPLPAAAVRRIGWAFGAAASAALLHAGGRSGGPQTALVLVAGLMGLAICAPKLLPSGFLRARRGLPAVAVLRSLSAAAFAGAETFIPLLLSRERGLSPTVSGLTLTVGAVSWSLGSWVQGHRPGWAAPQRQVRVGMACIAAGIAAIALAVVPAVPVLASMLGWSAAGFGMGLVYPALTVVMLELSDPAEQGRNSSALQLGDGLLSAAVLALGGTLLAASGAPGPVTYLGGFALSGLLALAGVLLAGRIVAAPAVSLSPGARSDQTSLGR